MSLCMYVCPYFLPACMYVCFVVSIYASQSASMSVIQSVCVYCCLSDCLYVWLAGCMPACLTVCACLPVITTGSTPQANHARNPVCAPPGRWARGRIWVPPIVCGGVHPRHDPANALFGMRCALIGRCTVWVRGIASNPQCPRSQCLGHDWPTRYQHRTAGQ